MGFFDKLVSGVANLFRRPAEDSPPTDQERTADPKTQGPPTGNIYQSTSAQNEPGHVRPPGPTPAPLPGGATEAERQRSIRSLEQRLAEHVAKLAAYRANPDAFDNQGFLRNAPSPEVRKRIVDGRIRHLEGEIANFQRQIATLQGQGGS
jgi:hypothetical protein